MLYFCCIFAFLWIYSCKRLIFQFYHPSFEKFNLKGLCLHSHKLNNVIVCDSILSDKFAFGLFRFNSYIREIYADKKLIHGVRLLFNDPDYFHQSLYSGDSDDEDLRPTLAHNLKSLWVQNINGTGIVVGVIDDGVDSDHVDLRDNYDESASFDFILNKPRVNIRTEMHGTKCIGLISSVANNKKCGVGVAFGAKFAALRILSSSIGEVFDSAEALAFQHQPDKISIYSMSWGPVDDGIKIARPHRLSEAAVRKGAIHGRKGLGSIYVWSSGNGGRNFDFCGYDGYLQQPHVFVAGSVDKHSQMPPYAERCTAILTCSLSNSNNLPENKIFTTIPNSKCGKNHTGTSVSAPIVSGILALLLQVKPNLSRRDIMNMIVYTSNQIDSYPIVNAIGLKYSLNYGFGLIMAEKLIEAAKNNNHSGLPPMRICKTPSFHDGSEVKYGGGFFSRIYSTGCMETSSHVEKIETLIVTISIKASSRKTLTAFLTSPSGTRVPILEPRLLDTGNDGLDNWNIKVMTFYGERAQGKWDLEMGIEKPDSLKLEKWSLTFYGAQYTSNKTKYRHIQTLQEYCNQKNYRIDSHLITWCYKDFENPDRHFGTGIDGLAFKDAFFVLGPVPSYGYKPSIIFVLFVCLLGLLIVSCFIVKNKRRIRRSAYSILEKN